MAKKKPYRFVVYLLVRVLAGLLFLIPRSMILPLARVMGRAGFSLVGRQRRKTIEHLKMAYGSELPEPEIQRLGTKVFENLVMTSADWIQSAKWNPERIRRLVDTGSAFEKYRELLAEGRGLISLTAHIGNWELLAGIFGLSGFEGGVLGRRIYYEPYNRWIVARRQAMGVKTFYRDDPPRRLLEVLRRGEILGILADQDIDSLPGVFVPFYGMPAYTPTAPVKLAMASGAPILPNFLIREPGGRYRLFLSDPIRPVVETSREAAVKKYTAAWMAACESMIRRYPEQWVWMHDRWKTKPEQPAVPETGATNKREEQRT